MKKVKQIVGTSMFDLSYQSSLYNYYGGCYLNLQFCAEDTYQATSRFHSFPTLPKMGNGLLVNKQDADQSKFYFPHSSSSKPILILVSPNPVYDS